MWECHVWKQGIRELHFELKVHNFPTNPSIQELDEGNISGKTRPTVMALYQL